MPNLSTAAPPNAIPTPSGAFIPSSEDDSIQTIAAQLRNPLHHLNEAEVQERFRSLQMYVAVITFRDHSSSHFNFQYDNQNRYNILPCHRRPLQGRII